MPDLSQPHGSSSYEKWYFPSWTLSLGLIWSEDLGSTSCNFFRRGPLVSWGFTSCHEGRCKLLQDFFSGYLLCKIYLLGLCDLEQVRLGSWCS